MIELGLVCAFIMLGCIADEYCRNPDEEIINALCKPTGYIIPAKDIEVVITKEEKDVG